MTEPARCASCGAALAPGTRFCTGCGAAVPPPAAPEPEPPAPAPPAPPRAPEPVQQWALGTPPANERWWHNPIVVVGTILLVLFGGGVGTWQAFFADSGGSTVVLRVLAPHGASSPGGGAAGQTQTQTQTTATAPAGTAVDVSAPVLQIQQILRRSEAGLIAARQQHDFTAALANRRALEAALGRIDVSADPVSLQQAYATLRAAIRASAQADSRHIDCACDTLLPADVAATGLKRRFARQFDPYARQYLGGPVDPERI